MKEGMKIILNGIRTEIKAVEKQLTKLKRAESVLSEEAVGGPAKKAKPKNNGHRTKPGVLEGFLVQAFRSVAGAGQTVKELVKLVKLEGHTFHSETHEDAVLRSTLSRMVKAGKVTKSKDGQGFVVYMMAATKPETVAKTAEKKVAASLAEESGEAPVDESGPKDREVDLTDPPNIGDPLGPKEEREPVHQHRKGGLLT